MDHKNKALTSWAASTFTTWHQGFILFYLAENIFTLNPPYTSEKSSHFGFPKNWTVHICVQPDVTKPEWKNNSVYGSPHSVLLGPSVPFNNVIF